MNNATHVRLEQETRREPRTKMLTWNVKTPWMGDAITSAVSCKWIQARAKRHGEWSRIYSFSRTLTKSRCKMGRSYWWSGSIDPASLLVEVRLSALSCLRHIKKKSAYRSPCICFDALDDMIVVEFEITNHLTKSRAIVGHC